MNIPQQTPSSVMPYTPISSSERQSQKSQKSLLNLTLQSQTGLRYEMEGDLIRSNVERTGLFDATMKNWVLQQYQRDHLYLDEAK